MLASKPYATSIHNPGGVGRVSIVEVMRRALVRPSTKAHVMGNQVRTGIPNSREGKVVRVATELDSRFRKVWRVTCVTNPMMVALVIAPLEPEHCPVCGRDGHAELISAPE